MQARFELILACGIPIGFFLLAFIVGCFEKRRVRMFESAEFDNPPSYLQQMLQSALARGCVYACSGQHRKYHEKVLGVLLLSPDRKALIVIGEGTIARLPYRETMLISRLKNGGFFFTVDLAGAAELDPLTRRQILMHADFDEMLNKHSARLQEGVMPVLFAGDIDWADLDEIYKQRVDRMVKGGLARYVDKDHEWYCYSVWGSFRATILHGLGQVIRPSNYLRQYKRQPG